MACEWNWYDIQELLKWMLCKNIIDDLQTAIITRKLPHNQFIHNYGLPETNICLRYRMALKPLCLKTNHIILMWRITPWHYVRWKKFHISLSKADLIMVWQVKVLISFNDEFRGLYVENLQEWNFSCK